MKAPKTLGFGLLASAAVALALIAGLLSYSGASAQNHAVSIGSLTQDVGAQGAVNLDALNMTTPLGAFTVEIAYDANVVSATACTPAAIPALVGCSPLTANPLIVNGASTAGLTGNTTLAQITFICDAAGSSALTLTVTNFADNLAQPLPSPAVQNGSVTCQTPAPTPTALAATATPTPTPTVAAAAIPATGGAPPDGGSGALPWLAAIAGAIALIGSGSAWFARQRRRVR